MVHSNYEYVQKGKSACYFLVKCSKVWLKTVHTIMSTIHRGEIYLETQVSAHKCLKGVALNKFCNVYNML
jgi:hypothetical protein